MPAYVTNNVTYGLYRICCGQRTPCLFQSHVASGLLPSKTSPFAILSSKPNVLDHQTQQNVQQRGKFHTTCIWLSICHPLLDGRTQRVIGSQHLVGQRHICHGRGFVTAEPCPDSQVLVAEPVGCNHRVFKHLLQPRAGPHSTMTRKKNTRSKHRRDMAATTPVTCSGARDEYTHGVRQKSVCCTVCGLARLGDGTDVDVGDGVWPQRRAAIACAELRLQLPPQRLDLRGLVPNLLALRPDATSRTKRVTIPRAPATPNPALPPLVALT
jgi:hypothetical protein